MKKITITPTLLNEDLTFSPIKYFVSKHSIYPNVITFKFDNKINLDLLYNRFVDKFDEFVTFFRKNDKDIYNNFCFIYDDKDGIIIFYYYYGILYYYSNVMDEGLVVVINELINSCYE